MQYRYRLQPYQSPSSRYTCPQCNARRCFVRYIDTQTGQQLAPHVGRCSREDKCGYHFKPGDFFKTVGSRPLTVGSKKQTANFQLQTKARATEQAAYYIHPGIANNSFTDYDKNNFFIYLIKRLGFSAAAKQAQQYRLGTSNHWYGATIFWQIDGEGLARTGKVMLYNKQTGKRVKKPFNHITWVHRLLLNEMGNRKARKSESENQLTDLCGLPDLRTKFYLKQCFFGEHLLAERPDAHVAIVESEKTAIIAAAHNDSCVWLACGGLSNLNPQLCQTLQNRTITLYPDLGAYQKWQQKARYLQTQVPGAVFTVSRLLEDIASDKDRVMGLDLGDVL